MPVTPMVLKHTDDQPSMSGGGAAAATPVAGGDKPLTKNDFVSAVKEHLQRPPKWTRNDNLVQADLWMQQKRDILTNDKLTPTEKIMLLKEINRNLNVYLHKYADSAAASHSKPHKGLSEDDIIQDMEPDKKERARQLLHSAVRKGVKWTATGDIIDPVSQRVIKDSDIQTTLKDILNFDGTQPLSKTSQLIKDLIENKDIKERPPPRRLPAKPPKKKKALSAQIIKKRKRTASPITPQRQKTLPKEKKSRTTPLPFTPIKTRGALRKQIVSLFDELPRSYPGSEDFM